MYGGFAIEVGRRLGPSWAPPVGICRCWRCNRYYYIIDTVFE